MLHENVISDLASHEKIERVAGFFLAFAFAISNLAIVHAMLHENFNSYHAESRKDSKRFVVLIDLCLDFAWLIIPFF